MSETTVDLDLTKPNVIQAIAAVMAELPAIGKDQFNQQQGFAFRGHDDVMAALSPLLAKHGVVIIPIAGERIYGQRATARGGIMHEVNLHVGFRIYGPRGDFVDGSMWGEGTDSGDKGTSKASTMAFKYFLGPAFAIRSAELAASDNDANTPEDTAPPPEPPDPEEAARADGWQSVAEAVESKAALRDMVRTLEAAEAIAAWEHWKHDNGIDTGKPMSRATFDACSEALALIARGADLATGEVPTVPASGPVSPVEPPEPSATPDGSAEGEPELGPCAYCGSTLSQRFVHEGRTRCLRGSACSRRIAEATPDPEPDPVEQGSLT